MTDQDRAEFEKWWYGIHGETDTGIAYPIALNVWLAARRSQSEQVRELVEAVEENKRITAEKTDKQQAGEWMIVEARTYRRILALAVLAYRDCVASADLSHEATRLRERSYDRMVRLAEQQQEQ